MVVRVESFAHKMVPSSRAALRGAARVRSGTVDNRFTSKQSYSATANDWGIRIRGS